MSGLVGVVMMSAFVGTSVAQPTESKTSTAQPALAQYSSAQSSAVQAKSALAPASYKSCSYPPNPNPSVVKRNAISWKAQGFTNPVAGIDISMWQHPSDKPINFVGLKSKYAISFVFIKGSDGGNRDSGKSKYWFKIDSAAAKSAGLIIGPYHYAVPGQMAAGEMIVPKANRTNTSRVKQATAHRLADAKLQAKVALSQSLGNPKGDLPLTLDFEERPCGWSWKQTGEWTRDFLLEFERLSGRRPMIYANGYFVNNLNAVHVTKGPAAPTEFFDFSRYTLWVASWGPKLGTKPRAVPIWGTSWKFWQFTSDGKLTGVPSSRTDLDVWFGTLNQLKKLAAS